MCDGLDIMLVVDIFGCTNELPKHKSKYLSPLPHLWFIIT